MGKVAQWPAKHPIIFGSFSFIFIFLPQWIADVWSLFSSEPLADVVKREMASMSLPSFSPYWITGFIGALMFSWLIYELRQNRKAPNQDTNQENIGGSLTDMDFDDSMDFVHSVVERQLARESNKTETSKHMPMTEDARNIDELIHKLAELRESGVWMRNQGQTMTSGMFQEWVQSINSWRRDTYKAINDISRIDAKLFDVLDTVPPARVGHAYLDSDESNRIAHTVFFNQHDFRLVKLDVLISKYQGMGN